MEEEKLFNISESEYGDLYKDHLFKQYTLYVESAEKISDRRQVANNYFLSINTTLITLLGISFSVKIFENIKWVRSILAMLGIVVCIIYWFLLNSYKQLNAGKYKVIHEIEDKLPLAVYNYEWNILERGENKKIYFPFSHIELLVPLIFVLIYFSLGILFLLK
jgi:hypothetical protein